MIPKKIIQNNNKEINWRERKKKEKRIEEERSEELPD